MPYCVQWRQWYKNEDPVQVVKQALIDAKYKKEVSVYGTAMKGAEAATKVLPHGMILKAMSMMEKITKE